MTSTKKHWQQRYAGKRVLILGLGLHGGGVGSASFFARAGAQVRVADAKTAEELAPSIAQLSEWPQITYSLGEHRLEDVDWAELIIRNPAIRDNHPLIQRAHDHDIPIEQDIGIFLQYVDRHRLVGVTGSKGKSTTAALIHHILSRADIRTLLIGNIGVSVLAAMEQIQPDTVVVLELSSFQLPAFHQHRFSPHLAVMTTILADHLNYHGSMAAYVEAKRAIAAYQEADDVFLYAPSPEVDRRFLSGLAGRQRQVTLEDLPAEFTSPLSGRHNRQNIALAVSAATELGVSRQQAVQLASTFEGMPFRLQPIRQWRGVTFINDSAATNPGATIKAIEAYPGSVVIVGGVNKDLDYADMAEALNQQAKMVFLLPGSATNQLMPNLHHDHVFGPYESLEALMAEASTSVQAGDVVLFSPGAASFNLFHHEFDRGQSFNDLVQLLPE